MTPDAPQTANSAQRVILMSRKVSYACPIISYHVHWRSCPVFPLLDEYLSVVRVVVHGTLPPSVETRPKVVRLSDVTVSVANADQSMVRVSSIDFTYLITLVVASKIEHF